MNGSYQPKLSIVFLNYNRLLETRYTVSQLKSLMENRGDLEIIAVDNASTDGTGEYLRSQRDWLTLVDMDRNLGIGGLNEGFKQAQGRYLLILDDDSHPHDSATVESLIQCLDTRSKVGVVACRIESPSGEPVRTWHLPPNDTPGPSMAFVACGFAIRRELFEAVGWFPAEFFLYQNEVEVAIRVMLQGYEIYYEPGCRVVHRESPGGRTSWRRVYFPTRNTIWIIRRYFPFPQAAYLIGSRLCLGFVRALQYGEFSWYSKAVKEAFSTPIERKVLPPAMRKRLRPFWRENSLWHHVIDRSSWDRFKY